MQTLDEFRKQELGIHTEEETANITERICDLYRSQTERFSLGVKRAGRLVMYSCGQKDFELDPDFMDVRNKIREKEDRYRQIIGPEWDGADDKKKIISGFLSDKIVLEALGAA